MSEPASVLVASAMSCALLGGDAVTLKEHAVRVADVVALECLAPALRHEIGSVEIARLAPATSSYRLSREAIASLVRRRVPLLSALDLNGARWALIAFEAPTPEQAAPAPRVCYVAARSLSEGETLNADAVEPAPCGGRSAPSPLRYDRLHRVTRAATDIARGEPLGAIERPPTFVVDRGDDLTLSVRAGSVAISRSVVAAAPSRGGAVLVEGEDGEVFAAPAPARRQP